MNIGSSASPADGKHGDGGARAKDMSENPREPPIDAERSPTAGEKPRARDVRKNSKGVPIDAERTLKAADNPRVSDVQENTEEVPVDAEMTSKAEDQLRDAAAYGGLRATGLVGEASGPGRLQYHRDVSAQGDLVWLTDWESCSDSTMGRVVVFLRTTGGGHIFHRYVAESPVQSPRGITATDMETWISQDSGQLQGVRLQDAGVVLTRTLPVTGRLMNPLGLAYKESTTTLYVCCKDGLHVVDVAAGGVVATLNKPPKVQGELWRPWFVSVLQDTILVAYGGRILVLYTGDGAPGRVLYPTGLSAPEGIAHDGDHFVVCNYANRSLHVVSREGEAVTRVGLGKVRPWYISWPSHHRLLYVTDWNNKLWVVSR